jgi:hypothetical protein
MQMYLVLIDYGTDVTKAHGMEALPVKPELTRRQIVEQVREVLASDDLTLVHVKFLDGNYCCDISDEIIEEANADDPALPLTAQQAAE